MYKEKSVAAVIVAAGNSSRMKKDKMLLPLSGMSVVARTVKIFSESGFFDEIILVSSEKNLFPFKEEMEKHSLFPHIIKGGATRGESSFAGICAAKSEYVMIHDGARALVDRALIERTLMAALTYGAAFPYVTPKDTLKLLSEDGFATSTLKRDFCASVQTPQVFKRELIKKAYEKFGFNETDDCAVMEKSGAKIKAVEGSYDNIKLTTSEDIHTAQKILADREKSFSPQIRIGTGFDTHALSPDRSLIIGGVEIPYEKGLLGHSDADVLLHAIIDALFGAAALGDIGTHFPDTDEEYRGISSLVLLQKAAEKIRAVGFEIINVDSTIIAQSPKMAPFILQMRENAARAMKTELDRVSIKAKTNEHMGFTGRGEGIEARATVLLGKF